MIKVLIVEDDPMVGLINKRYLEKMGNLQVYGPVKTEEEIIDILNKEEINLILLDVFLPQKSGIDILKSLRAKDIFVDVIMVTAANGLKELEVAYSYGVVDYLIKPFEFKRLEESIDKFKLKNQVFNQSNDFTQEDIDLIYNNNKSKENKDLPKGVNQKTFEKIKDFLSEDKDKVWTLREISSKLNISNVTIKKYMDYLEDIDEINVHVTCGNVGRPEYKYSIRQIIDLEK